MRTIKFRAISLCRGEHWLYGDIRHYNRNPHTEKWTIYDPSTGIETDVDETTIGQFTGLTDKNGKEIWEGDIVMFYETKMVVIFDDDAAFKAKSTQGVGIAYPLYDDDQKIVIGNIHDNPELLK